MRWYGSSAVGIRVLSAISAPVGKEEVKRREMTADWKACVHEARFRASRGAKGAVFRGGEKRLMGKNAFLRGDQLEEEA